MLKVSLMSLFHSTYWSDGILGLFWWNHRWLLVHIRQQASSLEP